MSNMSEIQKMGHNWFERDNKRKSRSSMTKEEVEYNRIVDRQRKRKAKKSKRVVEIDEVDNSKRELLEWVEFYKESDESKKVLKRKNFKFFSMCKAQCNNEENKNSDTEEKEEENECKAVPADKYSDSENEKEENNDRERKQKSREQRSEEKREYDNILSKHDMRKFRRRKTHLIQREKQYWKRLKTGKNCIAKIRKLKKY
jgi:hypothetical protein